MTNSLEREMCQSSSVQDIHPLLAPGEAHCTREERMSRGGPGCWKGACSYRRLLHQLALGVPNRCLCLL